LDIVADTSVIIAVIADEPEKAAIVAQTQGADLFAPLSLPWEVGNAFSAMLKRGRITLEQAKAAIEVYERIPLTLTEIDLTQSLEWADRLKIYAYDSYLIVCALNRNCPLLTLDSGLIYAAKVAGVTTMEVK
jgi:predicted nucleic acid-binding protein